MYPRLFLAILPALLSVVVPSLALPVQPSDALFIEARSFDLSSNSQAILARDVADESLVERDFQDGEADIFARAVDDDIFPRAFPRPKATAHDQKARKDAVRAKVAHNQAANAAKKAALIASPPPRYGTPTRKSYKKDKAMGHIISGWRADARKKGFRAPKQPKTPKPNFAKGEHKTNAKAVSSQAAAKARLQAKKAAGRGAHADANAIHALTRAHGNMPARNAKYHVPGHGTLTGKAVRTGAYNLAKYDGVKKVKYPVAFKNMEQGPPENRHKPIPGMVGHGIEYPINNAQHGFHATSGENPGPVRGIYQKNAAGGYNIQGVVAHDTSKHEGDKGFNDHHLIHPTLSP